MLTQFDAAITSKNPEIFKYVESKGWLYPIYYFIHSDLRQATRVSDWANDFCTSPSTLLKNAADKITTSEDCDYQMTDILRWVENNITYVGDTTSWKMSEYWQTPDETLTKMTGDCEDGAILVYTLAILKGVPPERLLIFAGDVEGGGHCWCGYRSNEYPLNWCFMDWCYWYNRNTPNERDKYYILDTTIYDDTKNRYKKIWFGFNHLHSYKGISNAGDK